MWVFWHELSFDVPVLLLLIYFSNRDSFILSSPFSPLPRTSATFPCCFPLFTFHCLSIDVLLCNLDPPSKAHSISWRLSCCLCVCVCLCVWISISWKPQYGPVSPHLSGAPPQHITFTHHTKTQTQPDKCGAFCDCLGLLSFVHPQQSEKMSFLCKCVCVCVCVCVMDRACFCTFVSCWNQWLCSVLHVKVTCLV